jgi:hypothetical protein
MLLLRPLLLLCWQHGALAEMLEHSTLLLHNSTRCTCVYDAG